MFCQIDFRDQSTHYTILTSLLMFIISFQADCLQQEVDSLKEKLEEVTLDLQILKEDMEPAGMYHINCSYPLTMLASINMTFQ